METIVNYRRETLQYKGESYRYWEKGSSRLVYVNEDFTKVIKKELNERNLFNLREFEIYEGSEEFHSKMAMTEYDEENNWIIQEFVDDFKLAGKRLTPTQKEFARSCRFQVGFQNNGDLVCYDLDEFNSEGFDLGKFPLKTRL